MTTEISAHSSRVVVIGSVSRLESSSEFSDTLLRRQSRHTWDPQEMEGRGEADLLRERNKRTRIELSPSAPLALL